MTDELIYNTAAEYRRQVAELLAKAIIQFEGCKVTWGHAKIYADEMKAISVPDELGKLHLPILEEGLKQLRALVTEK